MVVTVAGALASKLLTIHVKPFTGNSFHETDASRAEQNVHSSSMHFHWLMRPGVPLISVETMEHALVIGYNRNRTGGIPSL